MTIDLQQFKNPPAAMRGAPFWSLNCDMNDHERLFEHIDAFAEMGFGGYHLHVRPGLQTSYMSEDFLTGLEAARDYGNSKNMLSYLYDEDTWPSGFAGGMVTRDLAFRQRWLEVQRGRPDDNDLHTIIAAYQLKFDASGYLISFERVDPQQATEDAFFASLCIAADNDRYNGAAYVDVLNPHAIDAFIQATYTQFLKTFTDDGKSFPGDIPSIFTDEPQMAMAKEMTSSTQGCAVLPWTDTVPQTFKERWGEDILELLPNIIWRGAESAHHMRWRFWDHISECFASSYTDRIGAWCESHGIALTGHMNCEPDLWGQRSFLGEAMRHYRGFQIPGIDILCDHYEPSTAKQAVSVARQDGRQTVMSELYGVTNWDFPFSGHKCQGDWQAAMGINLRVPHLAWTSMAGQSKRDYPAAIGIQSPWYAEYSMVEDHFARVHAALSNGRAFVRVGMIHPIESAWMVAGVQSLDSEDFNGQQQDFENSIEWLIDGQIDFDFIAESLLPQQERKTDSAQLQVGCMAYDVIVLAGMKTVRSSTLSSLMDFQKRGGTVIVVGSFPIYCDGILQREQHALSLSARRIAMRRSALLEELEKWREISVDSRMHGRRSQINHQVRVVDDERILFCSHRLREKEIRSPSDMRDTPWLSNDESCGDIIRMRGSW